MVKYSYYTALLAILLTTGCSKIDPNGFLVAPSNIKDRYIQSKHYFDKILKELLDAPDRAFFDRVMRQDTRISFEDFTLYTPADEPYTFLVGADFHVDQRDTTRLATFMREASSKVVKKGDKVPKYLFTSILGDIAETQPDNYDIANDVIKKYMFSEDTVPLLDTTVVYFNKDATIYPVVGNHDITHNGWAYYTELFGTSTYYTTVYGIDNLVIDEVTGDVSYDVKWIDVNIFLDSANGTMGEGQLKEFLPELFESLKLMKEYSDLKMRNVFVYTHNPFFRPRYDAVAANFPRDELYWLMNYFTVNDVSIVFSGHIHAHGDNSFNDVRYVTLDAFSRKNSPIEGELASVTVSGEGNANIKVEYKKFK